MGEDGTWRMKDVPPPDPRAFNPQVDAQLGALILRMLALSAEARGTAGKLAEAFEAAMERVGQERGEPSPPRRVADVQETTRGVETPLPGFEVPAEASALPGRSGAMWRSGLVGALAGVLLAFGIGLAMHVWLEAASSEKSVSSVADRSDESPADLGDLAPAVPLAPVQEPSERKGVRQGQPPKPFPGQLSPDAKGQCPGRKQVPINGGCWVEHPVSDAAECEQYGYGFLKGRCYSPVMDTRRKPQPTSDPPR